MKKIAIIGSVGIPAKYGGFETLAQKLVDYLEDDFQFTVYCTKKLYKKEEQKLNYKNASLKYLSFSGNGISSILYDTISILKTIHSHNALLVLGISGAVIFPVLRLLFKTPVICHVDGLEWKRNKWNFPAKIFLRLSHKIAIKFATKIIIDNEWLKQYIKSKYYKKLQLIQYGGNYDKNLSNDGTTKILDNFSLKWKKYYLAIARIEPENNIELILKAFEKIKNKKLVIVGDWNNKYAKKLYKAYHSHTSLILENPIYNEDIKTVILQNCTAYIHGHSCGGTNPSLVEAMNANVPILAHDNEFNRQTTENMALYFHSKEELEKIINSLTPQTKNDCKKKMFQIAKIKYNWNNISNEYKELFIRSVS